MIGILDYGMGNLRSVQKALEKVGAEAVLVDDPSLVPAFEKLILPGVGNFADGMEHLRQRKLVTPVLDFIEAGRPLMGICLGMQLLLEGSTEDAPEGTTLPGLGVIAGTAVRFEEDAAGTGDRLKVPHMGWNRIEPSDDSPLFAGLPDEAYVYFVHGYFCKPTNADVVAATADYGSPFCAAIHRNNVWATQFHPEKSQHVGLQILRNFAEL